MIPAELRARAGISQGTRLHLLETDGGLVVLTRARLRKLVRADLPEPDLVQELLSERRTEVSAEGLG